MAWMQKRPVIGDGIQLYSMGMVKNLLLVGLGNIGTEYDGTRHNIGFTCLDAFVAANDGMDDWINKKDLKAHVSSGRIGDARIYAIKPTTFMNLSGEAVQAVAAFYKIPPEHIIIVHDELDIDFGGIRMRVGGSAAGHNGIKSISQQLGTEDYGRIRIGIGPKHPARIPSEKFVLQAFSEDEQSQIKNLTQEVNAILSEYTYSGTLPNETRNFLV
jgi:PTH1 family peptidyl-tRNA hydrolase